MPPTVYHKDEKRDNKTMFCYLANKINIPVNHIIGRFQDAYEKPRTQLCWRYAGDIREMKPNQASSLNYERADIFCKFLVTNPEDISASDRLQAAFIWFTSILV